MAEPSNLRSLRLSLSLIVAGAAILLCAARNHFSPSFSDPGSLLLAADHRCGWVLIAAFTWASLESLSYLVVLPRSRA